MNGQLPRREFLRAASGAGLASVLWPPRGVSCAIWDAQMSSEARGANSAYSLRQELLAAETDPYRRAVLNGDVKTVEQFLARDPGLLYARDVNGQSVYLLAAYADQPALMSLFESKGLALDVYEATAAGKLERFHQLLRPAPGMVNMPNLAGDTPLHVAALCHRSEMIENAITYGPDFAVRNPKRKSSTAAHLGLQSSPKDAAEAIAFAMIGNGLDPNLANADGDTILHCAARTGYPRVIRLLLEKGASTSAKNAAGETAVDIAAAAGNAGTVDLVRNAGTIPQDYYARRFSYDPKFASLRRDDTEGLPRDFVNNFIVFSHFGFDRVKKLIELCSDLLNTRASWDELPVEAAAHMGRADIGGLLLDRGASYSICTAAVFGSAADVKRMLSEDPRRVHERGAHSFPLLFYTAFGKPQLEVAEYLISAGADPKEEMRGRTVLHTAASAGHLELCRFFLEKGLDPRQKGTSFLGVQDAVEAAELAKHPEVAAMMRDWIQKNS
jgi:ankyrin repeat protein